MCIRDSFRNGDDELGITTSKTPYNPDDAELLWAVKYGTGWAAAPGSPIMVDGDLVTYTGSTIRKLDRNTGAVVAEGTMVGSSNFSIVPATYGDGMIFVGLSCLLYTSHFHQNSHQEKHDIRQQK